MTNRVPAQLSWIYWEVTSNSQEYRCSHFTFTPKGGEPSPQLRMIRQARRVKAYCCEKPKLIMMTSASRPRYLQDLLDTIALPPGMEGQFTYRRKWFTDAAWSALIQSG
jgi:hypothetical protein